MPVEFKDDTAWRRAGAAPVPIPTELSQCLDKTYEEGKVCEIPADDDCDTEQLLRLMRIYAGRQNRKIETQFFIRDGDSWLRFRMRDKRPYTRTKASKGQN